MLHPLGYTLLEVQIQGLKSAVKAKHTADIKHIYSHMECILNCPTNVFTFLKPEDKNPPYRRLQLPVILIQQLHELGCYKTILALIVPNLLLCRFSFPRETVCVLIGRY
jgi:hypothetical protein